MRGTKASFFFLIFFLLLIKKMDMNSNTSFSYYNKSSSASHFGDYGCYIFWKVIISKFEVTTKFYQVSVFHGKYSDGLDIFFEIKEKPKLYLFLSKSRMKFI